MDHATLGRRFLLLLLTAFVALTALGLHGSSVVMWSVILHEEETAHALLLGQPQPVRSDEWLVWTPSALAQAQHEPPWPVENPALGAGHSPQLMSLPVRHLTTLFRPQLWGFFLFDFGHGFAWSWNVKICGLLAAMFVLIRRLAGGDFWCGLLGSAWVFLSGYVQWWFACPPMLPEMLASWALGLWFVMVIVETARPRVALAATAGLVFATVNFALCMYPPFQIPLAWLGLAVLGGWLWQRRAHGGEKRPRRPAAAWLGLAAAGVAAVLVPCFVELLPTLRMVAATSYPGARRATGGALGAANLFLGLAGPLLTARAFPEARANVCSAAGFYPIWLAAACWLALAARRRAAALPWRRLVPLLAMVLGLALFASCPLPAGLGRWTLLSFTTEERCLLPIGLGGILLSVLTLREMRGADGPVRVMAFVIALSFAFAALLSAAGQSRFFPNVAHPRRRRAVRRAVRPLPLAAAARLCLRAPRRVGPVRTAREPAHRRPRAAHGIKRPPGHRRPPPRRPRRPLAGLRRLKFFRLSRRCRRERPQRLEDRARPRLFPPARPRWPRARHLQPLRARRLSPPCRA